MDSTFLSFLSFRKFDIILYIILQICMWFSFFIPTTTIIPNPLHPSYTFQYKEDIITRNINVIMNFYIIILIILFVGFVKKDIVGTSNTLLSYLFGECLVGIIITILKRIYGTPRPYYNTYCIENYKPSCNHSFPSGHSAYSFQAQIFLTLYLTMLIKPYKMYKFLVVRLLLCIPILISCFVGISRVIDNHHSLTDVLVGSIIGSVVSFTTFTTYKNSMITKKEITEEELFSIEFG
ncbi:Lipid phosphate phosphatase [Entamoeba marina]